MIRTLVSINTDLKSSIALRYVSNLPREIEARLYGIHVIESKKSGTPPGSGWVQKTWENAIIESKRQELRQLLDMEKVSSSLLSAPTILIGDRSEKLLEELDARHYDLFLEGMLPTFESQDFYAVLSSKLYRQMHCPALVVKNLVPVEKVAILFESASGNLKLISDYLKLCGKVNVDVDLIDLDLSKSTALEVREQEPESQYCSDALDLLTTKLSSTVKHFRISGTPSEVAEHLKTYGLVASLVSHKIRKKDRLVELLGRVQTPILICWK